MTAETTQIVALCIFVVAIAHTFLAPKISSLGHKFPRHAGLFHLLGEVEAVFGIWSGVLIIYLFITAGFKGATAYVDGRNYTEPMFVIAIMVIAGSKPVLHMAKSLVTACARVLPLPHPVAMFWMTLTLVPLLGSFITEPAAMTLAAFMLRDRYFAAGISTRLKYAIIGVLFVNISIGGVLTPYAAPPVLMVAGVWNWDIAFMLKNFGWRAAIAVAVNSTIVTALFFAELKLLKPTSDGTSEGDLPAVICIVHVLLLAGVVVFAHHPPLFMGCLLMFLGVAASYPQYQDRLILREALMVGFFLAGLVVLGGMQQWWLQPLLTKMTPDQVYFGATALTAITDNAALTYLGSLVQGLSPEFKYMLVAGAVTGGGLTVIANAPNPAGYSILKRFFPDEHISPLWLFLSALGPTVIAIIAFWALPSVF
jgi:hypothetical protein